MSKEQPRTSRGRPLVVGLLGGVGSGKSTVANELARLGAVVLDADAVAKDVSARDDVRREIRELFGDGAFTPSGDLDRAWIADRVFTKPEERERLNRIIHPRVRSTFRERLQTVADSGQGSQKIVVFDVPLLLESELNHDVDVRIFIDVPESMRVERVRETRGWSSEELRRRESAQASLREKRERADYILQNDVPRDLLRSRIEALWTRLTENGQSLIP